MLWSMVIQRLVPEDQNLVNDSMLHGKPVQFVLHGAYIVKLVTFIFRYEPGCIILAAIQSVKVGLFC